MEFTNSTELKAAFPEFINEIEGAAREEGAKAERERLQAIDQMAGKVKDEVLNKAKYETLDAPETVALEAVTSGAFVNATALAGMAADAASANAIPGFANSGNYNQELTDTQMQAKFAEESAKKFLNRNGGK